MKHLILVGACYLDTILSVPHYPGEDEKLRATSLAVRRGGNCPNSLEVLQQLIAPDGDAVRLHLVACLPDASSAAARRIRASFAAKPPVSLRHCLYREGHAEPASSYIIRSAETGSRTIVNYHNLPEMKTAEFSTVVHSFAAEQDTWWHFEGRMPTTTLECIRLLRHVLDTATVSVEIEKPGREGLPELAAEADVVFYSRTWAESRGHTSPETCLEREQRKPRSLALCTWGADGAAAMSHASQKAFRCASQVAEANISVVDAVGAGDTFIAGMLYGLTCHDDDWSMGQRVAFAVELATLKVQQEGFCGLAALARETGIPM